jgi:hypothetical protein
VSRGFSGATKRAEVHQHWLHAVSLGAAGPHAHTGPSRPCPGLALVMKNAQRVFPCLTSRPGSLSPHANHACLALGSEVAREAGKAKLFDFGGFLCQPRGRQPGRQQLVTAACLPQIAGSYSREQLGRSRSGQSGNTGQWNSEPGQSPIWYSAVLPI